MSIAKLPVAHAHNMLHVQDRASSGEWVLFTGSWLQEVMSFSRAFFLVVVQNVGWGVLYDVRVYPFPNERDRETEL
jgi:hypothetical protein